MNKFILLIVLTFTSSLKAQTLGNFTSAYGEVLRYKFYPTQMENQSHKVFIYVSGDGDICYKQSNPYELRKEWHDKTGQMYSESGNWVFAELLTSRYCDRPQRLDGLGFSYRYEELTNLIAQIESDFPQITEIYLMGYSAGPWVAIEVANRLKNNQKIKGIMIGGFTPGKLQNTLASIFLKHGDLRTGDTSYERRIEIAKNIHQKFHEITFECSTQKKTMFGVFPFDENDPTEKWEAKRTDNHYCEANIDGRSKIAALPARLKILVLQGELDRDHTIESAFETYNVLLATGKFDSDIAIVKGVGHSFGYQFPQISKIILDWSQSQTEQVEK